jgi:4,5-DOPA dioxygenase extradiol
MPNGRALKTQESGAGAPAVFVSHGSPMVAIETGPYQDALRRFGREHRPAAIVVFSAHWDTGVEIRIGCAARHRLIYDFGGFPRPMYELAYAAPGDPALAGRIGAILRDAGFAPSPDETRGLDHGVWIPLRLMYPEADTPVVEVSLPAGMEPEALYRIGSALAPLRREGILILGSGGIVHNLALLDWRRRDRPAKPWAASFDAWFRTRLEAGAMDQLFRYADAPHAALAVPTNEHFVPVFAALGAAQDGFRVEPIFEGFQYGTLSMRSFALA